MQPVGPPEEERLVEVRRRRHAVTEVVPGSVTPGVLLGEPAPPQHLVNLDSIEDDGLGERRRNGKPDRRCAVDRAQDSGHFAAEGDET